MPYDAAPAPTRVELPDGASGRDVLAAVGTARLAADATPLSLVGHGSSGVAVLSLALHQRRLGLDLAAVTCVGATDDHDPVSGAPLPEPAPPRRPTTVTLVALPTDDGRAWAERTAAAWSAAGWSTRVAESSE